MRLSWPAVTIERLRTLVLVGGVLLIAAIGIFLAAGRWRRHFLTKDLPRRLGIDIQQQADGVDYTQSRKGKTLFKIHAARAVRMKEAGKTLLHDVRIDLYGEDGKSADTIQGSEFEYDPGAGIARAAGAVEITLMRPGVKPAITQLKPGELKDGTGKSVTRMPNLNQPLGQSRNQTLFDGNMPDSEIHVKTSGLTFNQKTGIATTAERVVFSMKQGNGSSIGAAFDSNHGHLVLDHAVELHAQSSGPNQPSPLALQASHAEFERTGQLGRLVQAHAEYTNGTADAAQAVLYFRDDGSVIRLDGSGGMALETKTGGHLSAPNGSFDFDEENRIQRGFLSGGAVVEQSRPGKSGQPGEQIRGASPTARLAFGKENQLRQVRLEQGVQFESRQPAKTPKGVASETKRTWRSQTADLDFAPVSRKSSSSVELRTIHGQGGVVITSESIGAPNENSRLSADSVVAQMLPGGSLSSLIGTGHASFDQHTPEGVHQSSTSDYLEVHLAGGSKSSAKAATEIASISQSGNVILTQDPPPTPSQARAGHAAEQALRASAARADYDGSSQILHLSGAPRIEDGALDLTAARIDFARITGDAYAHGDVKASWANLPGPPDSATSSGTLPGAGLLSGASSAGGTSNGPVHAVAPEAELRHATGEVIFRGASAGGSQPRIWQSANSVSAPTITLNRQRQTLTATTSSAANPVRTVLVSAPAKLADDPSGRTPQSKTPSVIQLSSGDLHYSEGERTALLTAGAAGAVTAETIDNRKGEGSRATIHSDQTEVHLLPAGAHSQSAGVANTGTNSVDEMIAKGHVHVDWQGRRGTGEKLLYESETGVFTLTGTGSAPPRITDSARGSVTGNALIFHTRDDSVTVEGGGSKTVTETQSPK